jgi:DNA-binding transcriptional regulator YiaG
MNNAERYHYTESGLDNIYLENGFEIVRTERGQGVRFHDLDGLHAAIGRALVEEARPLTGRELRVVRVELLLSQAALARLLGVKELPVARWENGRTLIPAAVDAAVRALYLEKLNEKAKFSDLLRALDSAGAKADRVRDRLLREHPGKWERAA